MATCNCTGCASKERVLFGMHKDILSDTCPEGSVATVTRLRTAVANSDATYDLLVRNPDGYFLDPSDFGSNDYVYRQVSKIGEGTTCHDEGDSENMPVIGDRSDLEVTLNCEAFECNFEWQVIFGCQELGVLTTDTNGGLQVLSDVDDTLKCANPSTTCDSIASCTLEGTVKSYLSGIDRRLEHKEMYPGAAELLLGLALGPEDGNGGQYSPSKAMLLSARPREGQFALAIDQDSELNIYMESSGGRLNYTYWGINTDSSFYGTLFDGTSFKEFGQTKARSFIAVSDLRPNTRFAFICDNGQGDQCAAQSMLESANGDRMEVVLIHQVKKNEEVNMKCESPEGSGVDFTLDLPESEKVHYYRTYSDAAIWTFGKQLISCCSASNVFYAIDEFVACRCDGNICPEQGLITGISEKASRNETLEFCEELRIDQVELLKLVDKCDPRGQCPLLGEISSSSARALLLNTSNYLILSATLFLILVHVRHVMAH